MTTLPTSLSLSKEYFQSSPTLPVKERSKSSGSSKRKKRRKKARTSTSDESDSRKRKKKRTKRSKKGIKEKKEEEKSQEKENKETTRLEQLKQSLKQDIRDFNAHYEEIGKEIGVHNYEILSLLGVGAQGRVYLVRLTDTGQLYAMKVFLKEAIIDNAKVIIN